MRNRAGPTGFQGSRGSGLGCVTVARLASAEPGTISRRGNCPDNAPLESFFHTLKVERVHQRLDATRNQARRDLFAYIEGFYNSRRLHPGIGYRSPADMTRMTA